MTCLSAWMGAVFWVPLVARPFWPAALWTMAALVTLGWMQAAHEGRLGRVPLPCLALVAWSLGLAGQAGWIFILNRELLPGLLLFPIGCALLGLAAVQWMAGWEPAEAVSALTGLRWSLAALVVLGWLQALGVDQFSHSVDNVARSVLGGTLGNATLFAILVAMSLPLWMLWTHRIAPWVVMAAVALILRCGSSTGLMAMAGAAGWVAWRMKRWGLVGIVLGAVLVGAVGAVDRGYLNPMGRLEAWAGWLDVWRSHNAPRWGRSTVELVVGARALSFPQPITGFGLGAVAALAREVPSAHLLSGWAHAHCEPLTVLIELGLIGLAGVGWLAIEAWHRLRRCSVETQAWAGGVVVASCLASLTSFTWHLPQTALLTLFAYSRIIAEGEPHGIL